MPLAPGTRLGPYEIRAPIGEGGMGEVYRARDTQLDRDVAIKVLPEAFSRDAERLARFEREAKLLASLNHPNIASIYGFDNTETGALVLELVEGPTLAEQIARGPLGIDDAVAVARQLVDALEAGHEAGVVHRDLKPANVKVKEDGTVKVLDYGLAKALEGNEGEGPSDLSQSPTVTRQGTQLGVILGTAGYMSPEQAKGKRVDRRADIWAFGVVFFEMLAGERLFNGETVSETLASVIKDDPDWSSLPGELPAHVRHLLERCLTKDPRLRLRDIGEARIALSGALPAPGARELETTPAASLWQRALPWGVAGMAVLALAVGLIGGRGKGNGGPAPVSRLTIDPSVQTWELDISPDGRHVAFTTDEGLMLRALDDFTERLVEATSRWQDSTFGPVYSPDGATIAFAVEGSLKRVSAAGGVVLDVAELPSSPLGLAWHGNDLLVPLGPDGIVRVAMDSGDIMPLVTLGPGEHAAMPRMLPGRDGDAVLVHDDRGQA